MGEFSFYVIGLPAPQGSKTRTRYGMRESSSNVDPWRANVKAAALDAMNAFGDVTEFPRFTGPVKVHIDFYFDRPKSHFGTGRNADVLKLDAPIFVTNKNLGDGDKLQRSTYDALTMAGVWADDSLAVSWSGSKRYADHRHQGAQIAIWPAQETR